MKMIYALLVMLSLCSCVPVTQDTEQNYSTSSYQDNQPITVVAPPWLPLFLEKMNKEIIQRCNELRIPVPKIEFELNPAPIVVDQITGVVHGWILGYYTYETKTISIFGWGGLGYGEWFSEEELRYTTLHELLHWFDDYTGKPKCNPDHNAEFDKRLKELGWVRPDFKSYMVQQGK